MIKLAELGHAFTVHKLFNLPLPCPSVRNELTTGWCMTRVPIVRSVISCLRCEVASLADWYPTFRDLFFKVRPLKMRSLNSLGFRYQLSSDAAPYSRRKETSTARLRNPNNSHLHIVVFLRCIYRWRVSDRKVSIFTAYNEWALNSLWFILIIKLTRCTNFSNLFLEWTSTCFGQGFCPSSGV